MRTLSDLVLQPGYELTGVLEITGENSFAVRGPLQTVELETFEPGKMALIKSMALAQTGARLSVYADGSIKIAIGNF